jgi:hypothetical protein
VASPPQLPTGANPHRGAARPALTSAATGVPSGDRWGSPLTLLAAGPGGGHNGR